MQCFCFELKAQGFTFKLLYSQVVKYRSSRHMLVTQCVCYKGETKGAKMAGYWWFDTDPECKGDWAMWPATAQSAETH